MRLAAPRSAFTGRPSEPLIDLGSAKNARKKIESPSTMSSGCARRPSLVSRRDRMIGPEDVQRVVLALDLAQAVVGVHRPQTADVRAVLGEVEVLASAVVAGERLL